MDAQLRSPSFPHRTPWVTPTQVVALGLVAASMGWAVWLLRDRPNTDEIELLTGMVLPSSEMAIMEAAFDRAQLADHRTEGGRVWVPRSRQSAYMRALVDGEALPREFGGSLRRALEKNSPWQSRAVQDELLRVATQEELSLVICSMPGIERAAVLYDTESRGGFEGGVHQQPAKTASVNVCTQPDTELDPARVQAIRVLVSASIAGLTPERVAVTDLRSGRVHAGPLEADSDRDDAAVAIADPTLARKIAHERHLTTKVRQSLAFIKGAAIDVTVEFGGTEQDPAPVPPAPALLDGGLTQQLQKPADANAPASIQQPPVQAAAPPPVAAAADTTPNAILVSVALPESYFQSACRAAAERAGQPALEPLAIEQQELDRIRQHVLAILPATRDPARRRVTVSFFPASTATAGRRDQPSTAARTASRAESGPQPAAALPIGELASLVVAGRFEEVPRQFWLAATSVCVGLLAGLLWWAGGRPEQASSAAASGRPLLQPRIDWSAMDDAPDGSAPPTTGARRGARAAAVLLAMLLSAATAVRAGDPDSRPAIAPAPEPILTEGTAAGSPLETGAPAPLPSPRAFGRTNEAPQVLSALPLDRGPVTATAGPGDVPAGGGRAFGDWKLLAAILAAFAVLAAASRFTRRRAAALPPDVFEVLGEGSLAGPHAVRIVRFGPKTLLIGISAGSCHTLAELSDPQATSCIAAACRGNHPPIRPRPSTAGDQPRKSLPSQPLRAGGEAA